MVLRKAGLDGGGSRDLNISLGSTKSPPSDHTYLMGANTYRLMYGFATEAEASGSDDPSDEEATTSGLTDVPKVVFSTTLEEPLSWANTQLVKGDAVEAVGAMKRGRHQPDEHDRQPHVVPVAPRGGIGRPFPGGCLPRDHGEDRTRPDLRRLSRCRPRHDCRQTFDDSIQLLEYAPTVLAGPPGPAS